MHAADTAFVSEILPHERALRATARRLGGDPDELVQETYLRALAARDSYRRGSNARAWLQRILVNAALTEHRRRRREGRLAAQLSVQIADSQPMPSCGARLDLVRALARLSAADRRLVLLAEVEGLKYRDLARVYGCPIGTVMSRLHRARLRLRGPVPAAADRGQGPLGVAEAATSSSSHAPLGTRSSRNRPRASARPRLTSPSGKARRYANSLIG
jgi:RNA polymerase sigma-70 factor (ECF subfamily)